MHQYRAFSFEEFVCNKDALIREMKILLVQSGLNRYRTNNNGGEKEYVSVINDKTSESLV